MNLKFLMLSALCLWSSGQQVYAQQRYVDSTKLPRADRINPSPFKIQIVDDTPKITSTPPAPDPNRILVIPVGQRQTPATEFMYINPAEGSAGISGLPPGMAAVNLSQPPVARFGTNISPAGLRAPANLPPGYKSSGLGNQKFVSGKLNAPSSTPVGAPVSRKPQLLNAGDRSKLQQPLTYETRNGYGAEGSTRMTTNSVVKGERIVLPRRTLLDKAD
jgi:hypothetical protein